jgi:hypothetical protein
MCDPVSNYGDEFKLPRLRTFAAALEFDSDQLGVEHDFGVVGEEF